MKFHLSHSLSVLGCLALASCYPYPEDEHLRAEQGPPEKNVSSQDQQKIQQQRDRMKEREAEKKEENEATARDQPRDNAPKPDNAERKDFPFANPVPGKEGFVFSPFNNKVVDVRDIPSGTLVQDPTYPAADKKYFRVP